MKNKVSRIPGIVGMDAWASRQKVTLLYDSTKINATEVKRAVFTPSLYNIRKGVPEEEAPDVLVGYYVGVWELWDGVDNAHIYRMLRENPHMYGFSTEFGEPVYITVYMDPDHASPEDIKNLIERDKYTYTQNGEKITEVGRV
ncbi:MAG: hypothetical protein U5N56_05675 [Candidatus Marinimicrobia bacterium]|nr:hypothetical protein [Candidatus Neomarinimicrobiota bacterium]